MRIIARGPECTLVRGKRRGCECVGGHGDRYLLRGDARDANGKVMAFISGAERWRVRGRASRWTGPMLAPGRGGSFAVDQRRTSKLAKLALLALLNLFSLFFAAVNCNQNSDVRLQVLSSLEKPALFEPRNWPPERRNWPRKFQSRQIVIIIICGPETLRRLKLICPHTS